MRFFFNLETYFSYIILLPTLIFFVTGFMEKLHTSEYVYITFYEEGGFYSSEMTRNVFAILYIPSSRAWWVLWSFESFPCNVCCSFGFCYFISLMCYCCEEWTFLFLCVRSSYPLPKSMKLLYCLLITSRVIVITVRIMQDHS